MAENLLAKQSKRLHDITKEQWELAHLQLGYDIVPGLSPFDKLTDYDISHPDEHLLSIMMNPDYFGWTCSKILNTEVNDNGLELLPMQCAILKEMWYRPFPIFIATRGFSKSFSLAIYSILRALFIQGRKIIITGAGFRQSKIIFSYAEAIWYNSPILRELCGAAHDKSQGPHHDTDVWWMQIGDSQVKALPLGDGSKIRGQRAHDILCDEFSSVPQQIFEEVVAGFGVVNIDPISQVKHYQRLEYMAEMLEDDFVPEEDDNKGFIANQIILSGTASFSFNHFYSYWKKQRNIITSNGNKQRLIELGIDPNIDHKKYSIIRIPIDLLPKGFMDEAQVQRARNMNTLSIYWNEYGAVFSDDSSGFFRRSLLEKSMPSFKNPVILPSGETVEVFQALLKGDPKKKYVMAIDTASEKDKFAIVILELYDDHTRIVYCWTTDRQEHIELRTNGHVKEKDFYAYTHRKIRDLMKLFNIIHIAIDSQGGGRTIAEALHNELYLEPGEQLIWELDYTNPLWDGKERPTDDETGLHILEMCNFRDNKYLADANHGMKDDFERRLLLFPFFDAIEVVLADKDDYEAARDFDTLQDVLMEVDALKDELQTIEHDATPSGVETWRLPKVKGEGQVGRLYDDRYSALLMASSAARRLRLAPKEHQPDYVSGGFVGRMQNGSRTGQPTKLYTGPSWFTDKARGNTSYGMVVKK